MTEKYENDNDVLGEQARELFENLKNVEITGIAEKLEQNRLPWEVENATEKAEISNKLNDLVGELNNYLNELKNNSSTNPDEITCLEDCIKNKFNLGEQGVQDILDVRSKKMTIADFMGKYMLFINGTKTGPKGEEIKWKEAMSDETKVFIATKFNEIFRLLWVDNVFDSRLTLGENTVDVHFVDINHSEGFQLSENFENENSEWKEFGQWILDKIALIEWRKVWENGDEQPKITIQNIKEEINKITDNDEKKIAEELWDSINTKLEWENDLRVSMEDRAYLFAQSMIFMWEYRTAFPDKSPQTVFEVLNSNQNKILHQHLSDLNTITSSDHWIKHVLRWDMTNAEVVFSQISEEKWKQLYEKNNNGESLEHFKAKLRVLTMQAMMDHDLGYTNDVNRMLDKDGYKDTYKLQSDHDLYSALYVQNSKEWYVQNFGEEWYKIIFDTVSWHGNAQTDSFRKIDEWTAISFEFVSWTLSTVDCAWSPWDYKIAHMFAQKEIIWSFFNAYELFHDGDSEWAKTCLINLSETIKSMPDWPVKESWLNGINAFLKNWNFKSEDFEFYFEKFIWAYWIKTTIDTKTWNPESWINAEGGWKASYELSWKSFEYIYDSFWIDIALKSFISVCGDYWISKKWETIGSLKKIIDSAGEKWKNSDRTKSFGEYINEEFNNSTSELSWMEKIENGVVLKGPNNVSITLRFDWSGYEWFDDSVEKINEINGKIDEMLNLLENVENWSPERLSIINNLQVELADLGSFFNKNDFAWYEDLLKDITDNIVNLNSDDVDINVIKNQVQQVITAYHFQLKDVKSSNPNIIKS